MCEKIDIPKNVYFGKNTRKTTKQRTNIQTIGLTSFALPTPIIAKAYVINPIAIPSEIEYAKIMKITVINPLAAKTKLSQSIPLSCCAINIPTTTNAGAVTAFVTQESNGEKNTDKRNRIPVVIAVKPVLPPTSTPEVDSTNDVTVEVPIVAQL